VASRYHGGIQFSGSALNFFSTRNGGTPRRDVARQNLPDIAACCPVPHTNRIPILSSFLLYYIPYAAFTVVLVLVLRAIKSTWLPPEITDRSPCGFGPAVSLSRAAARFLRYLCPQLLFTGAIALWTLRAFLGHWSWVDAVIIGGMIVLWPFLEWLTHAFLLHWRPLRIFGRTFEPIFVITHRAHHHNPWDAKVGLAVPYVIAIYVLGPPILATPFLPFPQAITAAALMTTLLLNYEWLHFLIHTSYQPRSRLYKRVWRNHRLHHFKSEHHWFGVTATLADVLLRSNPSEKDITHSETCMDLAGPKSIDGSNGQKDEAGDHRVPRHDPIADPTQC
jgi:hypothetical protein